MAVVDICRHTRCSLLATCNLLGLYKADVHIYICIQRYLYRHIIYIYYMLVHRQFSLPTDNATYATPCTLQTALALERLYALAKLQFFAFIQNIPFFYTTLCCYCYYCCCMAKRLYAHYQLLTVANTYTRAPTHSPRQPSPANS